MVRAAAVMRRLMGGVWSLGWLAILLVGVPAVLVRYLGWPLPDHWPTRPEWERWVQQPLTRPAVIGGFAVLIWLMWAALAYALLVEVLTRVRRLAGWLRGTRLPPLPTPMQATASGMLGAAVFAMPAGAAHPPTPPAGSPPAAAPGLPAGPVVRADAVEADHCVAAAVDAHPPDADPDTAAVERGVTLPDGGWVSDQTAHAIAAVAAMVWWQRRRRYLPRPPTGAVRDDPDLAPLPPAATAVQDILHGREHPDDLADGGDRPPAGGLAVGEPAGSAAAAGDRAATAIGPGDLPAGGVGLTGPGALAAGRGILTAVLVSAGTGPHDNDARLVTTRADLHALLGPDATVHHVIPGMIVADGLDEAIALLEQHVLARGHMARHARHGSAPPGTGSPPLVLLTGVPSEPATAARLAVLLLCAHLGVVGALLGDWPQGDTWRIDEHGYLDRWDVAAATGGRLCVLTPTATADLLTMLREARPDPPRRPPRPLPPLPAVVGEPPIQPPNPGSDHEADNRPDHTTRIQELPRPRASAPRAAAGSHERAPAPLRLRLLGTPALHRTRGAGEPVAIQRTAALQILIFLAVHRGGATSSQLIAALWPGPRPQGAANRLYTPVNRLRTALREAAGADVLVRAGDRYRLDDQHLDVDLWQLHAAVDRAATTIDPDRRRRALHAVIDAYTGDLATDRDWSWLAAPREATRRHVVDAYVALAADEPDPRTALALLQDAVRVDPVNADLQRRAHHAHGQAVTPPPTDAERR